MIEELRDVLEFLELLGNAAPIVILMFFSVLSLSANWMMIKMVLKSFKSMGRLRSLAVGYSVASGRSVDDAETSINKIIEG